MLTFFEGVGGHLKFKTGLIDNLTFRLHYQYTFAILLIACLLQTAQQYLGNPIDCDVDGVPGELFNTFCWIHGTFTLPSQLAGRKGLDYPHPGVGPYPSTTDRDLVEVTPEGDEIRHAWYQWVIFILFAQVTGKIGFMQIGKRKIPGIGVLLSSLPVEALGGRTFEASFARFQRSVP